MKIKINHDIFEGGGKKDRKYNSLSYKPSLRFYMQ